MVVTQEELQKSAMAIREAAAAHGTNHPEVLKRVEAYVVLLHKADKPAEAQKFEDRARALRQILIKEGKLPTADSPPNGDELEVLSGSAAETSENAADNALAQAAETAETSDDTSSGYATERPLFDSFGNHICTELEGNIYTTDGRFLGRWDESLEVFIDKKGNYLGQIYEEDRFARDVNWRFRHMNFGARDEGDRSGWGRVADIRPTTFPRDFEDVKLDP